MISLRNYIQTLLIFGLNSIVVIIARLLSAFGNAVLAVYDAVEVWTTGWASPPLPSQLPRPRGLPLLGYLPFLGRLPHEKLTELAHRRYDGRAICLLAGRRRYLIVNSIETVRQMSLRYPNELRDRQTTAVTKQVSPGTHNDYPDRWFRRRAYLESGYHHVMRTVSDDVMMDEVERLVGALSLVANKEPVDVHDYLADLSTRMSYRFAYGRLPDNNTSKSLYHLVASYDDYRCGNPRMNWVDTCTVLRYIFPSTQKKFVNYNQNIAAFCRREQELSTSRLKVQQKSTPDESQTCLFDCLTKALSRLSPDYRLGFQLNDDVVYGGLEDFIRACLDITLLCQWFMLYLTAFPHVQDRMRQELLVHGAEGRTCPLAVDVIRSLSYCRAAFAETCRFCCLNPFVDRHILGDIEVEGVPIPQGTFLLFNCWAVHYDPSQWNHPDRFDPERFLTEDGEFNEEKTKAMLPFGVGKRRCVGKTLIDQICPLIVCSVVRRWRIEYDGSSVNLDKTFGISLAPIPFKLRLSEL